MPDDPERRFSPEIRARVGSVVEGRFVIDSVVGEGGMATVYLAHAPRDAPPSPVAIKILHAHLARDAEVKRRFRNEARAAVRLDDPRIIEVHSTGDLEDGTPYMVMEYLEGEDLEHYIHRTGALPAQAALELTCEIAGALDAAHREGIVHRDVKPSNCMLVGEGDALSIKVFDFGIAKLVHDGATSATQTGIMMGTPVYMPPEQARGEKIDGRVDVYALGAVLFFLLTGRETYVGETVHDVLIAAHTQPIPVASDFVDSDPPLSARVDALIVRALQRDRTHRFSDMGAMISAMTEALSELRGGPVRTTSIPTLHESDARLIEEPTYADPVPGGPRRTWTIRAIWGGSALALATMAYLASSLPRPTSELAAVATNDSFLPSCPEGMIRYAAATYEAGCNPEQNPLCYPNEAPSRSLAIDGFCLDTAEVTLGAYTACVARGACSAIDTARGCHDAAQSQLQRHPVHCIDWDRARTYCRARGARLPTESEWEFAARDVASRRNPPNEAREPQCPSEHMKGPNGPGCGTRTTRPTEPPTNAPVNLLGNVWEWVDDAYAPHSSARVARGGGFDSDARDLRASRRIGLEPTTTSPEVGFRCASDPK